MTESLTKWIEENKLMVSKSPSGDFDIVIIDDVGSFLYLKSFDGKVIDEDFAFILSDEEFDLLENGGVDFILFEFGNMFYYSGIKQGKNRYNELIYQPEFNDFRYLGKTSEVEIIPFTHLGVHSEYEILNGSANSKLWVDKAKFIGVKSLGICDKDTLAGTLSFQKACEGAGVKPVLGETITMAINYSNETDIPETFEMKLYVMNKVGWKNLLLINKAINVDYKGFIPDTELYKLGEGLCCVVPKDSEFNYKKNNRKEAFKLIAKYRKSFDEVYYQIDTLEYNSEQLFKEHLSNIDTYLCKYRKLLKPVLINDSYYLDKNENGLKAMLNKIQGKVNPESKDQYFKSVHDTIHSYDEWLDDTEPLLEAIMTGLVNANEIADKVDFHINTGERKLPHYEVGCVNSLFFDEIEKGVNERLGHLKGAELEVYLKRLETECGVIVPNELTDYFMILWDVIKFCKRENIMVGSGRGSVCGSLVAYLLHLTDVDPLKYDLLFERFLNETRVRIEKFWEIELENGLKVMLKKGDKLPLSNGKMIDIDLDLDLTSIDINENKLISMSCNT